MRWPWSRRQRIEVQEIDENCVVVIQCQQKITPEQKKEIWKHAAKLREQLATPGIQILVLDSSLTMRVYRRSWIHPTPFPVQPLAASVTGNGYAPVGFSGCNDPLGAP